MIGQSTQVARLKRTGNFALMSTEKTEAVVIRQANFSETSRVVTLFTHDWGKISTLAKGAKRLKSPFEAALDLLTVCRIVFIRKSSSSLDLLTEAQLVSRFTPNGRDLISLYGGYYVAELLNGLTEEYDPHPNLYQQAVKTLNRLSDESNPELLILRFELVVLREIGQIPAFDICVSCSTPLTNDQSFAFRVSQGGLICPSCQKDEFEQNRLQPGTVAILRRLTAESDAALDHLVISPKQHQELRQVATAAICHALGRRPKMLRYLTS